MSSPRTVATAEQAARRRRLPALLALHRRHAGRVRAIFYWFGADLEDIDPAVSRTFVLADRHPDPTRATLGCLAWRVFSRPHGSPSLTPDLTPDPTHDPTHDPLCVPALGPGADLLARFLATHTTTLAERAAFVLAEFAGLDPVALASLLGFPVDAMRGHLSALRLRLLADPEATALGGPRAVLTASLTPFTADHAWRARHAAVLADLSPPSAPVLSHLLQRPSTIIGIGLAAVVSLLLLRPRPALPVASAPIALARPQPQPPAPLLALPLPLPEPVIAAPVPAPQRKVVRRGRARGRPDDPALLAREKLAKARDPGAIIVELEMIGAGRKSLASDPRQALAYADQHARDYPDSQLIHQRAELRVRALCALGRRDEARAEASRRPHARVQDALRDACK